MEGGSGLLPRRATPSSARATKGMQHAFFQKPFRDAGRDGWAAWFPIMHLDGVTELTEVANGWRNDLDLESGEIVETPSATRPGPSPRTTPPMLSRGLCLQGMRGGAPVLVCRHIPLRAR